MAGLCSMLYLHISDQDGVVLRDERQKNPVDCLGA